MTLRGRLSRATLALSLVCLVPTSAAASLSLALSLEELTRSADLIVLVRAGEGQASRDARGRIVTDVPVEVLDVVSGDATVGARLTLRRLGGAIGDLGMRVEGEPNFEAGARYLVFARRTEASAPLRPVGMSQGVMRVRPGDGGDWVEPGGDGLGLVQRARGGRLLPAPPALLHPERLDRVRARVQQTIEAGPPGAVAP